MWRRSGQFSGWLVGILLIGTLAACAGDDGEDSGGAPAPSASATASSPGDHSLTISVGGADRTYQLHVPPGYQPNTALPLVIALHYRPGSAEAMRTMTELDAKADEERFLVAYPEGVGGAFNAFTCCGNQDDVGLVKAIAGQVIEKWNADPDRVYLTGASNGADLSFRVAVEAPGIFAAIAPVSGGFYGNSPDQPDYAPKSPVSVVTFIGLGDPMEETLRGGIKVWQDRLKCRPKASAKLAAGAVRQSTATCADGSEVAVYQVKDGAHAWFGARAGDLADADPKINATDVIWDFFAAHPRLS
jgi:poly(3-hydroxybutyrate) depolymerase